MDIPGIPDSIPRKRYIELIETLGLDATDLYSLEFKADGIYASTYVRHPSGRGRVIDDEEIAKHQIYIPVTDTVSEPT